MKGKLKEKIESNKELGLLSKKLATIITDVPVKFHSKDYELTSPNIEAAVAIFEELEFKRIQENFKKIFNPNTENNPTEVLEKENLTEKKTSSNYKFPVFIFF